MIEARWAGHTIAASDNTVVVEGNHYFPPDSADKQVLVPSDHRTRCHWKGEAHYYHVEVNGQRNDNAAWYYPEPLPDATHIRGYLAFWHGVQVS